MASEQENARKPSGQEAEERRENASDNLEFAKWMAHVAKDASTKSTSSALGSIKEGTMLAFKGLQEKNRECQGFCHGQDTGSQGHHCGQNTRD